MRNLFFAFLLFPAFLKAQENVLTIGGTGNDLYITHKAAAHENFYSIGRLYNISPKEIAPYNNLVLEKGLAIGQIIKIPLKTGLNFLQNGAPAGDEAALPVYHTVLPKETLFQMSAHYNKVPVSSLKAWNNLSADALIPGKKMIVGYLQVKKDISALAGKNEVIPTVKNTEPAVKEAPIKTEPVVKKTDPAPAKTEEIKEQPAVTPEDPVKAASPSLAGGVFKTSYNSTGKEESGTAGIFKSTSGWEDGKYYCLHNTIAQNTIVKITNKSTGKSVYAKVLGEIPDLKQNSDLIVRLCNAAADAIGAGTANFECSVNY